MARVEIVPEGFSLRHIRPLIFVVIGVLAFFSSCKIIKPGERGIVVRLGAVQPRVLSEGLHFVIPFMESVPRMSVRVQKTDIKTDAASKDLQTIKTDVVINWHIDPVAVNNVFQRLGDMESVVSRILAPAVSECLKAATAKHSATDILVKRGELKDQVDKNLVERVKPYDIIVDGVSLTDFQFSPEFSKAIEEKQVAEQEAQKAVYNAQRAKQEAQSEINRAQGQAEAQRLLRVSVSSEIIQLKAIEKWDGHFPQVMGSGSLPLINLKNLESKK